jgi:hypothetical protein
MTLISMQVSKKWTGGGGAAALLRTVRTTVESSKNGDRVPRRMLRRIDECAPTRLPYVAASGRFHRLMWQSLTIIVLRKCQSHNNKSVVKAKEQFTH